MLLIACSKNEVEPLVIEDYPFTEGTTWNYTVTKLFTNYDSSNSDVVTKVDTSYSESTKSIENDTIIDGKSLTKFKHVRIGPLVYDGRVKDGDGVKSYGFWQANDDVIVSDGTFRLILPLPLSINDTWYSTDAKQTMNSVVAQEILNISGQQINTLKIAHETEDDETSYSWYTEQGMVKSISKFPKTEVENGYMQQTTIYELKQFKDGME